MSILCFLLLPACVHDTVYTQLLYLKFHLSAYLGTPTVYISAYVKSITTLQNVRDYKQPHTI
jgi:hypothetical protein